MSKRQLHVITNSETETWRKCHALWGFVYGERLRAPSRPGPLSWGRIYHSGAAAGWRAAWDVVERSLDDRVMRATAAAQRDIAEQAEYHIQALRTETMGQDESLEELIGRTEEHRDTARWVVAHYFDRARLDLEKVPLAIEAPFRFSVPTSAGHDSHLLNEGVVDLILWDEHTGVVELQDHKGTDYTVAVYEARVPLDTQMTGYVVALARALEEAKREHSFAAPFWQHTPAAARAYAVQNADRLLQSTVGVVTYNVVRRAKPHEPKVNLLAKKWATTELTRALYKAQEEDGVGRGEVSVAQIDTLPEVYEAALMAQVVDRGQAINDKQRSLLENLQRKSSSYFGQVQFFRSPEEVQRWRRELFVDARRIRSALRNPEERTRNPWACTSPNSPRCAFSAVCLAPDSPEIRQGYRVASDTHEEVREAESHDRYGDELGGEQPAG
jgi:hypothetical protein